MPKKQDTPSFDIESVFPNIARWVQGGWIEVGDQDWRGFAASALDEGGIIYEKEVCRTLAEAMEDAVQRYRNNSATK